MWLCHMLGSSNRNKEVSDKAKKQFSIIDKKQTSQIQKLKHLNIAK
jgi:hypothetical protein